MGRCGSLPTRGKSLVPRQATLAIAIAPYVKTDRLLEENLETANVVLRYEEPTCERALPLGRYRAIKPLCAA